MRELSLENMSENLLDDLTKGLESCFGKYYKNSNDILTEDIQSYTELYDGLYSDELYVSKLPYPIRHAEELNVYTLQCKDKGVSYIPGMLLSEDDNLVMTSVPIGNSFTSGLLRSLLVKLFNNEYNTANSLLRTMQTIVALNGDFKVYSFVEDNTRYNENKNTMQRRILR